ncbi:MAG: PIN domain-containing protein [Actinomycetota bacterium]|nr:PIN domain-containing protein [Actinomycetota bacterium]
MLAVLDAGPLYAAVDRDDDDHERCVDVLASGDLDVVVPALVVAEVTYMVGRRLGADVEAAFLRSLERLDVEAPAPQDWSRIGELVERYREFPLGGTDASVVALAERLGTDLVVTLDHRHLAAVRPRHRAAFELLPD